MKKFFACLLAFVMTAMLLIGCNPTPKPTNEPTDDNPTEVQETTVKAGLICLHDENSTYDLNFINGFKNACEKVGIEYIIKTNIPESNECYEAALDLVDIKCNLIFADSFGHEPFLMQAAQENENVQFFHGTGTNAHTANIPNFHNAFAAIYEGRYLAGVAAGLKLNEMIEAGEFTAEEAKMGYIGAFTYAEVISGYTSFYLGAKSVCPTVTMEVQFTGSWYDETLEKEAAQTLIANGCKLISQHADSMGAPTACEQAGVPNVSYNGSTVSACPHTFIVSSRINWEPYFEYIITSMQKNEKIDTDYVGTIANGSVEMTEINEEAAAAGTAEKLEEVKAQFLAGELNVFAIDTFTVDGKVVDSYLADVDTDAAYTPDTEVIIDGFFNESTFRSAPYFDLKIDGIVLLNNAF